MSQGTLPRAPEKLIGPDGRPSFGNFSGAIPTLNLAAFDFTALRRRPWTMFAALADKLLKRWQFVGVIDEGFVIGAAVVHLNYVGSGFAYAYDRRSGEIVEIDVKTPLAVNTRFSPSAVSGVTEIRQGANAIVFENEVHDGKRDAAISFGDKLQAKLAYREIGPGVTTVTRQMLYGFNHCYKSSAMPVEGAITVKGQPYTLSPNALALLDWSVGTPPRETIWNWAAASGRDRQGRLIGLNFGCGLNEYSFTENSVWLDGQPRMYGGVSFHYNTRDVLGEPWQISTADGGVALTFHPDHERFENVNLLFAASRLHQPFGRFTGTIAYGKEKLDVELYGFCEEHYAKW